VVFLKPVAVAPAVVRRDRRVQAGGHPADHARLGVIEQQLDEMAGQPGVIDEVAAQVVPRGRVKGTARRPVTMAAALRGAADDADAGGLLRGDPGRAVRGPGAAAVARAVRRARRYRARDLAGRGRAGAGAAAAGHGPGGVGCRARGPRLPRDPDRGPGAGLDHGSVTPLLAGRQRVPQGVHAVAALLAHQDVSRPGVLDQDLVQVVLVGERADRGGMPQEHLRAVAGRRPART
jgi:hypothetical protein